jgi:hypothetical protein
MNNGDRASISAIALIIIFVLAMGFSALIFAFNPARMQMVKIASEEQEREILQVVLQEVLRAIDSDPTPESHWSADPLFALQQLNGINVEVTDISSRINPNWAITQLFERTELHSTLINGNTPESLAAYRGDKGYHQAIAIHFRDILNTDSLDELYTGYSLLNVNVDSEISIEDIIAARSGDPGFAAVFRNRLRTARSSGVIIAEEELETMFGTYAEELRQVLTVRPQININFAPERLIYEILSYPYGGEEIENHRAIAGSIINLRQQREISETELRSLIPIQEEAQKQVFSYLGDETSFVFIRPISYADGRDLFEVNSTGWILRIVEPLP